MTALEIDLRRLQEDIRCLGEIGRCGDTPGVHRLGFSAADLQGRRWLSERIEEAGGEASMDGAGNVIGRWFGDRPGPAVVVGSHLDSVAGGGDYDGPLGVLAGLECLRTIREGNLVPSCPIEVIAFSDEEGRFGGMFGAEALTGQMTPERVRAAVAPDGTRLVDLLPEWGLEPEGVLTARRGPDSIRAFLELHIEQGPVLDSEGVPLGVVEGIGGIFKWMVQLFGRANHAGTTPMHLRQDALMGMVDFAHSLSEILDRVGTPASRLTIGQVEVLPGYPHTVPGEVRFSLVGRDLDEGVMQELSKLCSEELESSSIRRGLRHQVERLSWLSPQACDPEIVQVLEEQAERLGIPSRRMVSGAGHDTQFMARLTRAGMIFVPSPGGVSHAPEETVRWSEVRSGVQVLLESILALAG